MPASNSKRRRIEDNDDSAGFQPYDDGQVRLSGSNALTRSDVDGSQIGWYGGDGPPMLNNIKVTSEITLNNQETLRKFRLEIEAQYTAEKAKELRKSVLSQLRREQAHGAKLDAEGYGRAEFKRQEAMLKKEVEKKLRRELVPIIEKEVRARIMVELEKEIRERVMAELEVEIREKILVELKEAEAEGGAVKE